MTRSQIKSYKDLIVWQKALDLVMLIYSVSGNFPKQEQYGLTSQVRRAAVSVPSNIAEGQARNSTAEFRHFLSIARGSLAEIETQLLIADRLEYLTQDEFRAIMVLHDEISKMIPALIKKLNPGH